MTGGETLKCYAIKYLEKAVTLVIFWLALQIYPLVALQKGQNQTEDIPRVHLNTLHYLLNILKIKTRWNLEQTKEQNLFMDPEGISPLR